MLLSVSNISKSYGALQLLQNVSFVLNAGEHMGCVGANGVGKSTLLRIIVDQEAADGGTVALARGVEVGHLAQTLAHATSQRVDDLLYDAVGNLRAIEQRMRRLEQEMAEAGGVAIESLLAEYAELSEQFERRGGYELDHRIEQVMEGLGLGELPLSRPVATLSGGEKARVGLAALLIRAPDLMLLDEPTNHLDFAALEWLEGYLQAYRGALFVISHDRHFLNQTVTTIVELDEHSRDAKQYVGNYDAYLAAKKLERVQWEEAHEQQQAEIKELKAALKGKARQVGHNRPMRDRNKMGYNQHGARVEDTIARNVRAAEERLKRIEADPVPQPPKPLDINPTFDPQALATRTPLWAEGLIKRFGARTVLDGVSLALRQGSRVVLTGPNGAGKSTLLKLLAGLEQPDGGDIFRAGSVTVGYLDQEQETLDVEKTVLAAFSEGQIGHREELKRALLDTGLFRYEELENRVGELSVGQRRKLQLAKLIAARANLLLLDEPTNHLAFEVLEQFEAALEAFPGPVLAISHDRRFIQRFAQEQWELREGRLWEAPAVTVGGVRY